MYNSYFGFSTSPFENNLDQRFLFLSEDHNEVLAALLYFISEGKAFAMFCGDVGTGKTMLINCFIAKLPESVTPVIISNPTIEYLEILLCIARELEINRNGKSILEFTDEIKDALIEEKTKGRKYVLVIDEAHLLSDQSLEHIRLLSNIETPQEKLLQILLVGQYELSYKLDKPAMRQLRQRISINRFLSTLDSLETIQYIDHRLKVVGASFDFCFDSDCKHLIYQLTGGVPRLINQICDNALLICKAEGLEKVNKRILKKSDEALRSDLIFTPKSTDVASNGGFNFYKRVVPWAMASICVVLLMLVGLFTYTGYFSKNSGRNLTMRGDQSIPESKINSFHPQSVAKNPLSALSSTQLTVAPTSLPVQEPAPDDAGTLVKTDPQNNFLLTPSALSSTQPTLPPTPRPVREPVPDDAGTLAKTKAQNNFLLTSAELEGKELPITFPESIKGMDTYFTVQVHALLTLGKDTAETTAYRLRDKGYPAYVIEKKNPQDNLIYKIRMGKYKTETKAKEMASFFQDKEGKYSITVKSSIAISPQFMQESPVTDFGDSKIETMVPKYSEGEAPMHLDNIEQKRQDGITEQDIKLENRITEETGVGGEN